MTSPTVDANLSSLYEGYYGKNARLAEKRRITGIQTLRCLKTVWPTTGKVGSILDVGAGEGSLLFELEREGLADDLYAVEISASGIEEIRKKKISKLREVQQFDGYKIPYGDKKFDLGVSIHVLEHVEHERLFLQELKRVANNIVIEVPLENTINVARSIRMSSPGGHINFYNVETLLNLLDTVGLKVEKMNVSPVDLQYEIFMSGRAKGIPKHYAKSILNKISHKLIMCLCTVYCSAKS
jgi:ubiquinone/menaquinone biosynthesis C-methylase UbiE